MILFVSIVFFGLFALGVPVAFVMGLSTAFTFFYLGNSHLYTLIPQRMFAGISNFVMLAIPFFILAGQVMTVAGITRDLVRLANALVGHLRGGLCHVAVVSTLLLSGLTGSGVADAASISTIMAPAMKEEGYDLDFSSAVISASAVIGPILPPSIVLVLYATLMNVSVAGLFLAGYVPGVIVALCLMVLIYFVSRKRKYPIRHGGTSLRECLSAFKGAILALMMPVIIVAGIILGIYTPPEAAAIAAAYALFIGFFVKKTLKLRDLPEILKRTVIISSTVLFVIATAIAFGWIMSLEQIPQKIASSIVGLGGANFYLTFLIFNILLFIAGMFLDTIISILLLAPILIATGMQVGIHPLHLAIVVCMNLAIGLIHPPLGLVLFVVSGVTKVTLERLTIAILPFIGVLIIVCLLISYVPIISMALPKYFGFYP